MVRTEVGYAGGAKSNPTYHSLGDHAEVLRVEFNPAQIAFSQFLDLFWNAHDPSYARSGSQYRAILLCENDQQHAEALTGARAVQRDRGTPVLTEIAVGKPFYAAEDYHQKWKLRRHAQLFDALLDDFDDEAALLRSFAATKLNAAVGGHLSRQQLDALHDQLSLSDAARRALDGPLPRARLA